MTLVHLLGWATAPAGGARGGQDLEAETLPQSQAVNGGRRVRGRRARKRTVFGFQRRTHRSRAAVMAYLPLGLNRTDDTAPSCPSSVCSGTTAIEAPAAGFGAQVAASIAH